jgi:hypothetical protein
MISTLFYTLPSHALFSTNLTSWLIMNFLATRSYNLFPFIFSESPTNIHLCPLFSSFVMSSYGTCAYFIIPYQNMYSFNIVFNPIIILQPSIYPFLNAKILVDLVMNIDFEIFVSIHFLQVVFFIYKSILGDFFKFNYHSFHFVNINSHTHIGEKTLGIISFLTIP